MYVIVEFVTEKSPFNEVVIWNRIIEEKQAAKLDIRKLQKMYPFVLSDQEKTLRGRQFNVSLAWNIMPKVGMMFTQRKTFSGMAFPEYYIPPKTNK